jgi:anti-sigma B factor antagonist
METLVAEMNKSGSVAIIRPQGRLDAFQAPALSEAMAERERALVHYIVINLANVDFIDSIALSILVQGLKHALQVGGELYLCNIQQPVQIIFELTRLDKVFRIFDSEQAAVNALENEE